MPRRLVWTLVALAALAGAAAAYYQATRADTRPMAQTTPVTRGDVVETVEATGSLEAVTTVQVGTQVSGTIKSLHADFNSLVRRNQVIAELEPSLFQTQVEQARATLVRVRAEVDRAAVQVEDAQTKLKRARELAGKDLISTADLDLANTTARQTEAALKAAEAQVVQAQASLNQAEVNLGHTVITAPIDGIVISRNVDVGQTVAASMQAPTLFVIARDLAQMRVSAAIDEADIGRVRPGQDVVFRVDAYPNETFAGTVSQVRLQPVVQQNVVSYVTIVDVRNPDLRLKPGMTATVTVETARRTDVLRVPNAALRFRPSAEALAALGQPSTEQRVPSLDRNEHADSPQHEQLPARLWVLTNGSLTPIPARADISDGAFTAITGGPLREGWEVVTAVNMANAASSSTRSPLLPFGGRGPGATGGSTSPRSGSTGGVR